MDFDTLRCQIKYDGPALREHTIDVNQLAPALLAFSEAMTKISKHISPEQSAICNVKIKAFNEGCFISDLIIETIQENLEDSMGAISTLITASPHVEQLFKIFVDVVKGKIFIKKHEGKNIRFEINIVRKTVEYHIQGDGNTIVTGNAKLTISSQAHQILQEGKIDNQLRNIVNPLAPEKIESLSVNSIPQSGETPIGFEVDEKEKEYFIGDQETKTMQVKVKGEIENMHKKYRTFGLVEGRSKIPCYIPKEESLEKYAELFNSNLVEIEGEAEISVEDNSIIKIKVTGGRKIQSSIFDEIEE